MGFTFPQVFAIVIAFHNRRYVPVYNWYDPPTVGIPALECVRELFEDTVLHLKYLRTASSDLKSKGSRNDR